MGAIIPEGFTFSQHSLGTYLRCARRFLLKYVERQPWPVPERDEPRVYAEHLARGRTLHQWIERERLGLDMQPIVEACEDPDLRRWWQAYRGFDWEALPTGVRAAELESVAALGDYRLYARYDYLALDPGGPAVVVDWKTLDSVPSLTTLRTRVQTRVYLYTLVVLGAVLAGGVPVEPERASMWYWFANDPQALTTVDYSAAAYRQDERFLHELVARITRSSREDFVRTDNLELCASCNYRTLCERDVQPSSTTNAWLDEDIDFDLELDDVVEEEY